MMITTSASATSTITPLDSSYVWLSYGAVLEHATNLGAGLRVVLSEHTTSHGHLPTVLLYAEASVEWYVTVALSLQAVFLLEAW
jgi:hypothetical protein